MDDDLLFAMRHPLRMRILVSLNEEGDGSPSDLGKRLGTTTEHCVYHVRVLEEYGFVKFVGREKAPGGVKSIYSAVRKVEFPREVWERLPPAVQNQVITGLFLSAFGDAEAALLSGAFEKHPESHASWTHIAMNSRHWKRLRKLLERTLEKALVIKKEAEQELQAAKSEDEELLMVSLSILSYPLPEGAWLADEGRPAFLRHEDSAEK